MNYNMVAMVKAGIGIALTLDKPEYQGMADIAFKPLKALPPIGVILIWKADQKLTRLNKAFLEAVETAAKQYPLLQNRHR